MTGLLITDEAAAGIRGTLDVDAIAEITSYAQYAAFGERLRALGFTEDVSDEAPLCRWVRARTILDVMPLDEGILGFANLWYPAAMQCSVKIKLRPGLEIRIVSAPYFIAIKFEAFKSRGKGDLLASRDLEDLISVIDGREGLASEVQAEPAILRAYVRDEVRQLLGYTAFLDALPGYLLPDAASQSRISSIVERLENLASIG